MRIDNLEFRKSYPLGNDTNHYYEIVEFKQKEDSYYGESDFKKPKEYCYTLLRWKWTDEQPDIQFVGERPFECEDKETLWKLMEYGQKVIQAEYNLKDK